MNTEELLKQIDRITKSIDRSNLISMGPYSEACELLRQYAGPNSSFYKEALGLTKKFGRFDQCNNHVMIILKSYAKYLKAGLATDVSPERQAQLDVVSDLLEQANILLNDSKVHPAAPAVLIGATLEEFLRTWSEKEGLSIEKKRAGIDSYTKLLREADLIDKQDVKDITAWAGIRNDAAHGKWEKVQDKQTISLMLQGINLFLRKYET